MHMMTSYAYHICTAGHVSIPSDMLPGCRIAIDVDEYCGGRTRPISDYPIVEAAFRLGGASAVRALWRKDGW